MQCLAKLAAELDGSQGPASASGLVAGARVPIIVGGGGTAEKAFGSGGGLGGAHPGCRPEPV